MIAALILLFIPDEYKQLTRYIALAGAASSFGLAIWIAKMVLALGPAKFNLIERYEIVPSLGIEYIVACDGWSAALLLLTGVIVFAGVCASWGLEDRPREFFIYLLLLTGGVYGVFVSQDLFVFFLFYEIAVLPMYLLIGIWGSSGGAVDGVGPFGWAFRMLDMGGKEYAAMKLTLMLLVGSAFILAAMMAMYWDLEKTGVATFNMWVMQGHEFPRTLQLVAFPLLWIGFGTLGGLWPFHTWSPDGHASAPTAVSMLHAGVLMKLGAFGVIRVGMMLLPQGALDWAVVVGAVAVVNVVYGAFCAMNQKDMKYVVAYSSVSHMGVILLGAATLTQNGWNGAIFQMVAHGVMTGMFFALIGLVYGRTHDRWVPNMGGFAKTMPLAAGFFTLAAMSSLGMPGTAGFVAEFLVFLGAWEAGQVVWAIAGGVGAFVTAVYVLKAVRDIFWGPGPPEKFKDLPDVTGYEHIALWTLGFVIVLLGLWPRVVLDLIDPATTPYLQLITGVAS